MCMDSTIPRKRLADMLIAIAEMEKRHGLRCVNVFHAGDGNLHPLILFDANDSDQLHRAEAFGAEILELSVAMGGTVTGEHGVGVEKLSSMCVQFSPAERERMTAVKRAFDPAGLLNPGKVIPTLRALRRVREDARQARPARVSRAAAVLSASPAALSALVERVRDANASRPARCCLRGGGSKDFYGETPQRRPARPARPRRPRRARADRAGRHRARRHERSPTLEAQLAEHGQCLAFEPPHFGAELDRRRHGRRRPVGARPGARRLACATTCSASTLL